MTEFTTGGQRHVFKGMFEAVGAASEWMENVREAFSEHLAGAGGVAATEAAHGEPQENGDS